MTVPIPNILVMTVDLTRRTYKPKMRGKLIHAQDLGDWKAVARSGTHDVFIVEAATASEARTKIDHRADYGLVDRPVAGLNLFIEPGPATERCMLAQSRAASWNSQLAKHGRVPLKHDRLTGGSP